MSASTNQRARIRAQLAERVFDIAIIGGGINGAAIARDAALRGYSVVLLEQDDFGAGTSSRSSGLLHGGVRYLEHAEFSLVFEALTERTILARRARHIARPIRFIFPIYDDSPRGMFVVNLGMWLYDVLALYRNYRPHRRLRSSDIRDAMPPLLHDGLRGAMAYYDYQTDDARMVLENVLAAQQAGAIALSRLKVLRVVRGTLNRLELQDMLDGAAASVAARTVVCAAGPWADDVLRRGGSTRKPLRPTKGVHIVLPRERIPIDAAVVLQNAVDRRVMFALPYFEHTVVGTTDTIYAADPGEVRATGDDVEYLLEVANAHFPDARVTDEDIISNWAGVRPLVAQDDNDSPGAISREHRIDVMLHGWVTIAGGKLTTYRKMASECVDRVAELLAERGGPLPAAPAPTAHIPLPGGVGLSSDADLDRPQRGCQKRSAARRSAGTWRKATAYARWRSNYSSQKTRPSPNRSSPAERMSGRN